MPYSFTQIERDKSGVIGFVLFFLLVFYVLIIAGFAVLFKCFWISLLSEDLVLRLDVFDYLQWTLIIFAGVAFGCLHYFLSISGLTARMLRWMGAREPDPNQEKHKMYMNILEEISAATGGRKFQGVLIPQTSLNAFALDDGEVAPVIGMTEGALYRLNREQIEGVVAHEAAHILKGDCSTATLVSAMFEFYTMPMRWFMGGAPMPEKKSEPRVSFPRRRSSGWGDTFRAFSRTGPIFIFFLVLIVVFYFITSVFAFLMRMLISREAKLRADAIAVRLTRNPLGLAQAIRLLACNWRGAASQWEALEGVFFVNPVLSRVDEDEGLFSDVFSTHPPIKKRLDVLLAMAHSSGQELEKSISKQIEDARPRTGEYADGPSKPGRKWLIEKDQQWLGPFTMLEIGMISWLRPQTKTKKWGTEEIIEARNDPDLQTIARNKAVALDHLCPVCKVPLEKIFYEKESVLSCRSCRGMLVNEDQAGVLMARRGLSHPPEAMELAGRVVAQQLDQYVSWKRLSEVQTQNGFLCPQCLNAMRTRAFNLYYPVVIDKCLACGQMWFEKGELEFLQALYEVKNPQAIR